MLNLYYGDLPNAYQSGDNYFDAWFDTKLLTTDFSKYVIKTIDKSEVISDNLIMSPVLGAIPPYYLSGGTKSLLILKYTDEIMRLTAMGENCYPILAEISKVKDITLAVSQFIPLFSYADFNNINIINDNRLVFSDKELLVVYLNHKENF